MRYLLLVLLWGYMPNLDCSGGSLLAQDFILEKLGPEINTANYDEIAPCIDVTGKRLYFTRNGYPDFDQTLIEGESDLSKTLSRAEYQRRLRSIYEQLAKKPVMDLVGSDFNQDIWAADLNNVKNTVFHPGYPLNNALPNSVSSLGTKAKELIVINQFIAGGGMAKGFSVIRQQSDQSWSFPEPLPINDYHNSGEDVNLTMSQNGQVIILSMERADALGRSDLYISFKQGNGRWTRPENMGAGVNSPWRETTPHLSVDGHFLYFASDRGYTSGGGSDIYVQEKLGENWTTWTAPKRFKAPINSTAHDSHPYFNPANGQLYFSSTRDGSSDIFRIQIREPEPLVEEIADETPPLIIEKMPVLNTLQLVAQKTTASIAAAVPVEEITVDLEVGVLIDLTPIQFKQSTATVLHQSYREMARLSHFLHKHPQVRIRVAGHTDNQGDNNLLYQLSKERALAIANFLIEKERIAPQRIEAVGYGGELPIASNRTEKGRKKNRRVEIEIIEVSPGSIGMRESVERSE